MLTSLLCAQAIVLSSFGTVLANPIPEDGSVAASSDVIVITGEPEIHIPTQNKFSMPQGELEDKLLLVADQLQSLLIHNKARGDRSVPAIGWDFSLQAAALAYAQQLAAKGTLEHSAASTRPNQGENLAYVQSTSNIANPITLAAQAWVSEKANYNNEAIPEGNFAAYGHYTQVVWNTTTRFGAAAASDGKGAWYTVARYSPPGNVAGLRPS